jgi:hypothetical protein
VAELVETNKKYTVGELLDMDFDNYVNFKHGKAHVLAYDWLTACGRKVDPASQHETDTDPKRPLCKHCKASRDWFVQGVLSSGN